MIDGPHTVHRWMMQHGIIMNEVLDLEELCADGVTEGVYIACPLKLKGASASLIDPIVIC
jgi:kynurenine formamidase